MTTLVIDKTLTFDFTPGTDAEIYDQWIHTVKYQRINQGQKAVDIVAMDTNLPPNLVWLIEAKDYRVLHSPPKPGNLTGLPATVAHKAQDSIAGLADAAVSATVHHEKQYASRAISSGIRRVVLHLEPHIGPQTALFPAGFSSLVLQRLRQLVRHIDPNPLVLNIATTLASQVPWQVS
jgi:hypothetical protein